MAHYITRLLTAEFFICFFRFRDEQLILLNWLASKEKQLKEIGETNLSDQSEVQEHLQSLRVRCMTGTLFAFFD